MAEATVVINDTEGRPYTIRAAGACVSCGHQAAQHPVADALGGLGCVGCFEDDDILKRPEGGV